MSINPCNADTYEIQPKESGWKCNLTTKFHALYGLLLTGPHVVRDSFQDH